MGTHEDEQLAPPPTDTVLVLDDYPLMRLGVFSALFRSRYEVVGLEDAANIAASLEEYNPALALIGAGLRDLENPAFIGKLPKELAPPLIFLTDAPVAFRALTRRVRGARGALHRQATADELLVCLETVSAGFTYVSPSLVPLTSRVVERATVSLGRLTWRETEVIRLVRLGLSNREIAAKLDIQPGTVVSHLKAISAKLGVRNRTEMAMASLPDDTSGGGASPKAE
jgi:DNA-binding NarL/FixJ family response regulator